VEVEIRVYRSSRLAQLAYYLMFATGCCAIAGYYLGSFLGWWAGWNFVLLVLGALLGLALMLTFPAIAGVCMRIVGWLSDEQLTAIGQMVGGIIERAGGIQRPNLPALIEQGTSANRNGKDGSQNSTALPA
jgi:hypothetical protein